MSKSLFEAVRDLIEVFDAQGQEFTEPVAMAINVLRPYVWSGNLTQYRTNYARVLPFPKKDEK